MRQQKEGKGDTRPLSSLSRSAVRKRLDRKAKNKVPF